MKLQIFKNIELDIKDLKSLKDYFDDGLGCCSMSDLQKYNQIIDKMALEVFNKFQKEWDIDFCYEAFVESQLKSFENDNSDSEFENGGVRIWE